MNKNKNKNKKQMYKFELTTFTKGYTLGIFSFYVNFPFGNAGVPFFYYWYILAQKWC